MFVHSIDFLLFVDNSIHGLVFGTMLISPGYYGAEWDRLFFEAKARKKTTTLMLLITGVFCNNSQLSSNYQPYICFGHPLPQLHHELLVVQQAPHPRSDIASPGSPADCQIARFLPFGPTFQISPQESRNTAEWVRTASRSSESTCS